MTDPEDILFWQPPRQFATIADLLAEFPEFSPPPETADAATDSISSSFGSQPVDAGHVYLELH